MNQNTPNPGLTLRWPHPCSLPIEWGRRGCPPNVNLQPRVVLDTQVWLPARDGNDRNYTSAGDIMFNSRGEHMTKTLEETEEEQQTPGIIRAGETRGIKPRCSPHYVSSPRLSVALGILPALEVGLWLKLILYIITFDLIQYSLILIF